MPRAKGNVLEGQLVSKQQQYGDDPKSVRDTDQYRAEYIHSFVSKWDALIDWEARAKAEIRSLSGYVARVIVKDLDS